MIQNLQILKKKPGGQAKMIGVYGGVGDGIIDAVFSDSLKRE